MKSADSPPRLHLAHGQAGQHGGFLALLLQSALSSLKPSQVKVVAARGDLLAREPAPSAGFARFDAPSQGLEAALGIGAEHVFELVARHARRRTDRGAKVIARERGALADPPK